MFLSGSTTGRVAGIAIAVFAIPVLVTSLRGKADRERNHAHPSR
jgi:hypothetical protein